MSLSQVPSEWDESYLIDIKTLAPFVRVSTFTGKINIIFYVFLDLINCFTVIIGVTLSGQYLTFISGLDVSVRKCQDVYPNNCYLEFIINICQPKDVIFVSEEKRKFWLVCKWTINHHITLNYFIGKVKVRKFTEITLNSWQNERHCHKNGTLSNLSQCNLESFTNSQSGAWKLLN